MVFVLVLNMLGFLPKTLDTMNVISKEKTLIKNHFPDRKKSKNSENDFF